ncbi:MAG: hypothetical protein KAY22_02365 [Rhizorhabdus sp.]|uniref:hypothetical protein n=1 Tax=Rhizorhabdus sp. TaxID=1968843 RepID=UPI001B539E49|nr:hypothetical protein [Rhizorhabdus sp.]MBP8231125.1 hypothetical protein [Rhizorhabdus sp.]
MVSCFARARLDDISDPHLVEVLKIWSAIGGREWTEFSQVEEKLLRNDVLLGNTGTLLIADPDAVDNLKAWCLAASGWRFPVAVFQGFNPLGMRVQDIPDSAYVEAAAAALAEAIEAGVPVMHRFSGLIEGKRFVYERIALPMYHAGVPDAVCTISAGYRRLGQHAN